MEQMSMNIKHRRRPPIGTENRNVKRHRRPGNYEDITCFDRMETHIAKAFDPGVCKLYWKTDDFSSSYSISLSNPDWRFLDTWYKDEVKTLLDMNADSPLADSLLSYLRSRIDLK